VKTVQNEASVISLPEKLERKKRAEILHAIEAIPRNEKILGAKFRPILQLIAVRPQSEAEDYLRHLKNRFPNTPHQQLLDFRRQLKESRLLIDRAPSTKREVKKDEIPEDIKREAEELLRNPQLIEIIQSWLSDIGIVGEEHNRLALWLMFLSRKLPTQIHAAVFGQSSSGKSELVKRVLATLPEDEVIEFSALSARALDYQGDRLKGKVIFISEMAALSEEIEYTLRIAMSEGKLQRGHVIRNEQTGEMEGVARTIEINSAFVITTTKSKSGINNENATRLFELYADESQQQTRRVIEFIKRSHSREYKLNEKAHLKKVEVLRAAQRLLERVDITIPYAGHLVFPDQTTRNRRDMGRFLNFLKVIAFLRRYQKELKTDDAGTYIEADLADYQIAYDTLLPIIRNTLDELSPRSITILEVCCLLQSELNKSSADHGTFTVNDIQTRAAERKIDLRNVANLRQELQELVEKEYLELVSGHFGRRGSRQCFRVLARFEMEESTGAVLKVANARLNILSPEELAQLVGQNQADGGRA